MLPDCAECQSICAAFKAAVDAVAQDMRGKTLTSDWCRAMRMQTEEDVVLSEKVFEEMRSESAPRLGEVIQRKRIHEMLTGHKTISK